MDIPWGYLGAMSGVLGRLNWPLINAFSHMMRMNLHVVTPTRSYLLMRAQYACLATSSVSYPIIAFGVFENNPP